MPGAQDLNAVCAVLNEKRRKGLRRRSIARWYDFLLYGDFCVLFTESAWQQQLNRQVLRSGWLRMRFVLADFLEGQFDVFTAGLLADFRCTAIGSMTETDEGNGA